MQGKTKFDSDEPLEVFLSVSEKIPFFEGLTQKEIKSLISDVKIFKYNFGEIVFRENEKDDGRLYYLLRGKLAVSKRSLDRTTNIRLAVIDKPALFGEMRRLSGNPRNATVEAAESETIVVGFKLVLFEEVTPISKFYKNVIGELSDKINNMNRILLL